MHYYQFNIGDYAKRTRHLSDIEDLAYRRLLDLYYSNESPMPNDLKQIARLIGLRKNTREIEDVLNDFFNLSDGFWVNKRADEEIAVFHSKADVARANGKKGGRPKKTQPVNSVKAKKTQPVNSANPEKTGLKANQEPRTKNQEPRTKKDNKTLSSKRDIVLEIFSYWCDVMKKLPTTKPTPKRIGKIEQRIKDGYSIEDIKLAITNCKKSPYHQGQNDTGTKYDDIELICRSGEKLEFFRDSIAAVNKTSNSESRKQMVKDWIEEDDNDD